MKQCILGTLPSEPRQAFPFTVGYFADKLNKDICLSRLIKRGLKSLLAGIFLFGFTIGTGSVTAMAKAGSDYGMSLLWTVYLSCLITVFLLDLFGKFTISSTETQALLASSHRCKNDFVIL